MALSIVSIESHIDLIQEELDAGAEAALEACGIEMERRASGLSPVDTGRLRGSITYETDDAEKSVSVGSNVEYAPYQELGTSRMRAANDGRGFLRPAIEDNLDKYQQIIEMYLGDATS